MPMLERLAAPGLAKTPTAGIARLTLSGELSRVAIEDLATGFGGTDDGRVRESIMDFAIMVIRECLRDHVLLPDEADFIREMKIHLGIREGDLLDSRDEDVRSILTREVERLFEDGRVDSQEDLFQVALQEALSLSYDEYIELTRESAKRLVDRWVAKITEDGVITGAERQDLNRRVAALGRVYSFTPEQKQRLARSRKARY